MKNFNSVQMFETSENCRKFSKSVSYETLVDGTATTGREYKQTRRLFLSSADKPLTAIGTLTSLLCNSAKVVEKWLQISPVFRFVKVLGLVVVLSAVIICKSQATEIPAGGVSGTCNSAGTCLWTLDESGKMTISASTGAKDVQMDNYLCMSDNCVSGGGDRPWENYLQDIKNVVVDDNITYIGDDAFQSAHNLETVTGMKDVTTIGANGVFSWATSLKSIEMPNVTHVGSSAFLDASSLESVDMPMVTSIGKYAFQGATALQYVGLPVDENGNPLNVNIADNAFLEANVAVRNCTNENRLACGSCGNGYVMSGLGCVSNCGSGYLGKDGRCINSANGCGSGYRQFENFCNRIRYTPAEAAKVLRDDNTNEVTITFKK